MRYFYITLGCIFTALGMLGIFIPIMPTTPFLLLSAALFLKSSDKLYSWLLNQRLLGPYLRNFMEKRAIPLHAKIISITLLWTTLIYCSILFHAAWLRIIFAATAIGVTLYIVSFKTLKTN